MDVPGSRPASDPEDSSGDSPLSTAADHAREKHLREDKRKQEEANLTRRKEMIKVICVATLSLSLLVFLLFLGFRWRNSSQFVRKLSEAQKARQVQEVKTLIAQKKTATKWISLLPFEGRIISAVSNANVFITNEYRRLGDFTNTFRALDEQLRSGTTENKKLIATYEQLTNTFGQLAPDFQNEQRKNMSNVCDKLESFLGEQKPKANSPFQADPKTATELKTDSSAAKPKEK
jgi:hypothetical protein